MHLDKFTDYGLRILMTLAVRAPDRVSVATMAKLHGVSEHHLSKIATELVRFGHCKSERGRGGGLFLAGPPDSIVIGRVVRDLKRDTPMAECFGLNNTCCIVPGCGLREPLKVAEEAFFSALDQYTLQGVIMRRDVLSRILSEA